MRKIPVDFGTPIPSSGCIIFLIGAALALYHLHENFLFSL
ncbi:Uncharacterized protein LW94_14017 [Fusarium fujikuroi]|nr:Uncharacterized protein LW93_13322 [Fusarium fujikuroi]KLP14270.1 Uncharacterized protein LW94_14017 [Fusarium fujikuroi]